MNEIVKYHNDMNTVNFYGFNSVELDLLFSICAKIRDKGIETITYNFDELRELSKYSATAKKSFIKNLENTYDKLIKLNFKIGNDVNFTKFVLFTEYTVDGENQKITISVNKKFSYILNQLTANFTRFELEEFVNLESKYSKNIYRLLKQFRITGKAYFTIDEFRNKLDIPPKYRQSEIDKFVLTPIIEELTPLFRDFRVEKVKNMKRRGQPVTHINFFFKPQTQKELEKIKSEESIRRFDDLKKDLLKTF